MDKKDFQLTPSGDLAIVNTNFVFTRSGKYTLRQQMEITLRMWMGEWFLNVAKGIPYRQIVMRKGVTKEEVDAQYISAINSFDEVISILSFTSGVDKQTRQYSLAFAVNTIYGKQTYTVIMASAERVNTLSLEEPCIYGTMGTESMDKFHKLIHIDLPTDISWI